LRDLYSVRKFLPIYPNIKANAGIANHTFSGLFLQSGSSFGNYIIQATIIIANIITVIRALYGATSANNPNQNAAPKLPTTIKVAVNNFLNML